MRFRGVASLNQVEALKGTVLEWGNRRSEVRSAEMQGVVGEGADSLPPHQLGSLGSACKLFQRGPGGAPAAESFSCILCHQIASPGTSVYSGSCVLSC